MDLRDAQIVARVVFQNSPFGPVRDLAEFVLAQDAEPSPHPISCYFCDRPASTMEAGYAVCEAMFHEGQRRRVEAPAPPERPEADESEQLRYAEPGRCGFCGHFPQNHRFGPNGDRCVCGRCSNYREPVTSPEAPPESEHHPCPPAVLLQHWIRDDGALVLSLKPHGEELVSRPVVVYLGDDVIADDTAPPPEKEVETPLERFMRRLSEVMGPYLPPEPTSAVSDAQALDRIADLLDTGADLDGSDAGEGVADIVASTGRRWDDDRFSDYGPARGPR